MSKRKGCVTCQQAGENKPDCIKRSVVYENIYMFCNPQAWEGKEVEPKASVPSLYVGESSHSLREGGIEHLKDFEAGKEDSHILKHHVVHHKSQGRHVFHLRPVAFHRTALDRQIGEAVRIKRRREGVVLNSKMEFNRCSITRLSLPEEQAVPPPPHVGTRLEEAR